MFIILQFQEVNLESAKFIDQILKQKLPQLFNKNAQRESLSEVSQNIFVAVWLLATEQRINPLPQGYQEGHLKIHIQDGSCSFWQKIAEFIFWYTWALNCYLILEMDWDIITDSWTLLPIESAGRTWYCAAVLSG